MHIEVAYQGRRKAFAGRAYDSSKLASYAPANLGFFFTSSADSARSFGTFVDRVEIDISNLTSISGNSENLREFTDRISKIKRIGRRDGVRIEKVIDGVYHGILYIIWNSGAIKSREEKAAVLPEEDMSTRAVQGTDLPVGHGRSVVRRLRDIFPMREDTGVSAIGGGVMGTQAIQSFDPVISFKRAAKTIKKKKRINKNK